MFPLECYNNTYGQDCAETCGHCRDSKPCHHINGSCVNGCAPGFKGSQCVEGKQLFPTKMFYIYMSNDAFETFVQKCICLYLQNAIWVIMALDVFKNAVASAKHHVTVTM